MTRRTVPPSAEIEDQIDQLLAVGVGDIPPNSAAQEIWRRSPEEDPALV